MSKIININGIRFNKEKEIRNKLVDIFPIKSELIYLIVYGGIACQEDLINTIIVLDEDSNPVITFKYVDAGDIRQSFELLINQFNKWTVSIDSSGCHTYQIEEDIDRLVGRISNPYLDTYFI